MKAEEDRVISYYAERKKRIPAGLYSYFNPGNLFIVQSRERVLLKMLRRKGFMHLRGARILEVGCGTAGELRRFVHYGALPENMYGVDLIAERIEEARRLSPGFHLQVANACRLPFENDFFDVILQFTVFTSISPEVRKEVAEEMVRVLKPGGFIVWYDFYFSNPFNKQVFPVRRKEIYTLFGQKCDIELKRNTLAPPIVRRLAPLSWMACMVLEKIPVLNTHYVGILIKR